ncbi:ectoine/hydroxyectoine ABC transporter substrate-binding protein EhuB [Pseudonocardia adelaidensis]|uniref:Ectoine/hydroxyectoine ABC transporter substrate-binding protein EhuB n=1 Tax=Pseudonocardia adelaidensis TaxID=648754 RepID=A0ABP9N9V8_9PSEU
MTQRGWSRRDFLRRTAAAGAVALGGGTVLGACQATGGGGGGAGGGSVLERARSAGSIKIGIAGEEPYGFTDTSGRVTGQAPSVARVVLQGIGIGDVQAEQVDFGSLIPALNANRYDMVCAGMNITPERCGQAAFSIPDYSALTAFLVPAGNPQHVKTFEDIASKGLPLAVLSAAVEQGYAESAGVPAGNISAFDDQNALLQAVTSGRAYAGALTDISLKWLAGKNPNAGVEVTEGFTPIENGQPVVSAGGFVFRQADNDLREAFNAELQKAHQDGRWLTAASPFGFSEVNLPAADLTTEKLCAA